MSQAFAKQVLIAGVSVILSYSVFVALFQNQCATLLISKEKEHNTTIQSLYEQHAVALEVTSLEDATRFLETQTLLTAQYQELLLKHEQTLDQWTNATRQKDKSEETIQKLNEQVKRLQRELGSATVQIRQAQRASQQEVESLRQQLDLSRSLVQQKVDEVRSLAKEGTCYGGDASELARIQAEISRRNAAQCVQWLEKPPYVVEFALQDASHDLTLLQVEFTTLSHMPHTVWTFLSLVDQGLYDGTTLQFNADRAITGGEPHSAPKQVHSSLQRQYATAGYGSEPLLFEELSPAAPCLELTFGFVGRGPTLLFTMEGYKDGGRFACPGRISSGKEFLQHIQQTNHHHHRPMTIQSARILRKVEQRSADPEL